MRNNNRPLMSVLHISKEYMVRKLTENDAKHVYMLLTGNPVYFEFCSPKPSIESVLEDMKALPPNKTYDDKFYIGFYKCGRLIAVMDLIYRYPNENTAFIGFFMMDKMYQGKGIGSTIIEESLAYLEKQGFTHVRLGYMKGNKQSRHFWIKNGFTPTGIETNNSQGTVVVMQRKIGP